MKWKYNNFEHASKDVLVSVSPQAERTPTGYWYATRYQITLSGSIFGDDQASLIANIQALLTAYSQDGGDLGLYFNDGSPTPDILIRNADCIGNVQITQPPHLDPRNLAEYSSYWDYTIGLEALVRPFCLRDYMTGSASAACSTSPSPGQPSRKVSKNLCINDRVSPNPLHSPGHDQANDSDRLLSLGRSCLVPTEL